MSRSRIPQLKTSGVVIVPVVMQLEVLECGAASLAMVMHYYGKWIPLEQARVDCGVSRDGANAKNIILAARSYGCEAKGWRVEVEDLVSEGPFPCIIHWGFNHFVVLCGFRGGKAVINDPARGRLNVSMEEFDREYTGVMISIEPGEGFEPSGKKKSVFSYAKERLAGTSAAVAFVVLTTTLASLMGVISPVFSRIFLDRLLSGQNANWLMPFIGALSAFAAVNIVVLWIAAVYSLRIQGKMEAVGSSTYLWKVLRLPMQFFSQRIGADIADRQATNASIAGTLVNTFAPLVLNTAMMLFYLFVMLRYSVMLTLIGVGAVAVNLIVSAVVSAKRVNITRVQMRDSAKLSGATASGIRMIETIKASGAERGYFGRWAGFQASVNTQETRFNRLNAYLSMIPTLVTSVTNLVILGLGVYLVLHGSFTIGMVMAFQGFLSSFMSPANSMITAGQSMQEMITQMERVDDVMSYPEDPYLQDKEKTGEYEKLSGNIEMKDITFGYARLSDPLITDFSLSVKPGEKVAIVGRSGCGKSTVARLLSGLYQPWSGSITFDGIPIENIDRHVFTGSVAVIDQNVTMFEDSVANNIRMWDASIEDFEMILAARDAGIHEDITMRSGGYTHKMAENGQDFSGGQRQRIEIARALAQDPTICILDEATSALDARTEYEVVRAISERGITCIVIAHRLSTIRDCNEIIVMENGHIVERGTHEELLAKNGAYTQLVTSE
ncbi:MAG: NHLP family bacteriocin export ABC transporter peptidase/permease/ATPase subunit [Eubacterium sp.]|nr:NHLP family bacteriocin export ABC transporter peptidase/permease/ATPase subunit [Eubacterium sp.]